MTARQIYEAALIELNKVNAPSLLLEDFNYLFNKAINQFINKLYNIYDINQRTTDDIRVLKATSILPASKATDYGVATSVISNNSLYGGTYEVILPSDYLHILNCICNFRVKKQFKCYDANTYIQFPATRLTADLWALVINNFYMRPIYKRPYYYIHNVNINTTNPTNPYKNGKGTDVSSILSIDISSTGHFVESNTSGGDLVNGYLLFEYNDTKYYFIKTNKILKIDGDSITEDAIPSELETGARYLSYITSTTTDKLGSGSMKPITYAGIAGDKGEVGGVVGGITGDIEDDSTTNNKNNTILYYTLFLPNNKTVMSTKVLEYIANDTKIAIETGNNTDGHNNPIASVSLGLPKTITLFDSEYSNVERSGEVRYGNPSLVRMEIRYGKDDTLFELESVYVDYIKTPLFIRLTQEQLDLTEDMSLMMEFPDYVCQEIINELVHILMENASDLRISSHAAVSQSIANPAQALDQAQQQARA